MEEEISLLLCDFCPKYLSYEKQIKSISVFFKIVKNIYKESWKQLSDKFMSLFTESSAHQHIV